MTDDELESIVTALERELTEREDIEAIKRLHRTYIRQLADREWSAMLDHFAEDAVVDLRHHGPRRGKQELASLFETMRLSGSPPDGYLLSSPIISISGDRATGTWSWHRHLCEFDAGGTPIRVYGPWWEGRYRAEYVRGAEGWKFARIWFRLVAPDPDLEAGEMAERQEHGERVILGAHASVEANPGL